MTLSSDMDEWDRNREIAATADPLPVDKATDPLFAFENDLRVIINKHSKENDANTPDFILADYLMACLRAFNLAANRRDIWSK